MKKFFAIGFYKSPLPVCHCEVCRGRPQVSPIIQATNLIRTRIRLLRVLAMTSESRNNRQKIFYHTPNPPCGYTKNTAYLKRIFPLAPVSLTACHCEVLRGNLPLPYVVIPGLARNLIPTQLITKMFF
jgi:hypothetical protein